ncbi:ubiquitin-like-conjugating enzyme ATG10 [Physcomitrium patens]|uniref:Uncharacterized protein n=1 Tax=Physcomitrium patens TaxID=3218 RepID=A0A2K1IBI2_PHYPA|nr:ubiquitin-like-conjugating enzyme ATG10 [Physcomitrium patens]XP_024366920.1 ubiquitin-like-conjugating enzyme ATG10 [Physcomitrium patens]PNR26638.1 hypothetical protein PHYPA_030119 [Physcomitrium patens]|eukprot:XP_024366919.1 ubiquitin-like-conjugating enzyme ATG10 [Physcomitrella patens]
MAPGAGDGTLTAEEFKIAALYLVMKWKHCCPDLPEWTWQPIEKTLLSTTPGYACGYLVLENVYVGSDQKDDAENLDEPDEEDYGDAEDQATMHGDSMGVFNQHLYTYHVVYNESYRVPMLFLQGRLQDGRPLRWDSVLRDLPVGSQLVSNQSRWTFLTQEDHPLIHRPWFALHPCGTSEIMRLVLSDFSQHQEKDSVPISKVLEKSGDMSGVPEKKDSHKSSPGRTEFGAAERSDRRINSEGQVSSWIEKYILTWMSFAFPTVGLAIPSYVFVDSK